MNLEIVHSYTNISDDVTLEDVTAIAEIAIEKFVDATYTGVDVIYQNFLSTFEQEPIKRQVLPLDTAEVQEIMSGIKPVKGAMSHDLADTTKPASYVIEPSSEEVLNTLVPQLVQLVIYHALLENKASEHSARMVAMKNATDKSKEVAKALTLVYNKERQAAITAEVSEITGGIEAMK